METVAKLIKESLPNYFRDLPVPNSVAGLFQLGGSDLLHLAPLVTILTTSTYLTWRYMTKGESSDGSSSSSSKVNLNVQKECSKVVDTCDIEDINKPGDKKVYCRCWRSKKFPLCDGSHVQHNEQTGDNVGPLIVANVKK